MKSLPVMHTTGSLRPSARPEASLNERPGASAPVPAIGASRFVDLGRWLGRVVGRLEPGGYQGGIDVEVGVTAKPVLAQPVLSARAQHAETVSDASAQVDRRRVGLVASRTGHLADPGANRNGLRDDLVVEDEIIGVALERQAGEQRAAESAQAGVIFRQFLLQEDVLNEGEEAVSDILVAGHAAGDGVLGEDA